MNQCRTDGRCQYAIDHGAEGLGHCPPGKCAQPPDPASIYELRYEDQMSAGATHEQAHVAALESVVSVCAPEPKIETSAPSAERRSEQEFMSEVVSDALDPSVGVNWMRCSPGLPAYVQRIERELAEARQVQVQAVTVVAPDGSPVAAPCAISGCQYAAASATAPSAEVRRFQGGLTNAELAEWWERKLPGNTPTDRELSAFALGVEVGETITRSATARIDVLNEVERAIHDLKNNCTAAGYKDRALGVAEAERLVRQMKVVAATDRTAEPK